MLITRLRILAANLTPDVQVARVSFPTRSSTCVLRVLDETTAPGALRAPESFRRTGREAAVSILTAARPAFPETRSFP